MDVTSAAVLVAVGVIVLPGLIVSWVSGLKLPWAAAAAVPVTFSIYGLAGWVYGMLGIRFGVVSVVAFAVLVTAVAVVWRVVAGKVRSRHSARHAGHQAGELDLAGPAVPAQTEHPSKRLGSILDPRWILPAAGVITGATLAITRSVNWLLETPQGINNIPQGWDSQWHANTVRYIMEEGMASATRMGELQNIESEATMYYPVAFHAATALVGDIAGIGAIAATNIMSIVIPSIALPLSLALLAWKIVGNRGVTAQIAAGFAGILAYASPVILWIGNYVGAWPYLAAVAVSGIVVAQFMNAPYRPITAFAAALGLAGATQLHPSAATFIVVPVVLWWLLSLLIRPARIHGKVSRLRDLGVLVGAGIVGVLLLLPQLLLGSGQTEEVASFDAVEDVTRAEAWTKAFLMDTRHVEDFFADYDPTVLLWVAGFGAVALLLWRRNIWAPVFYALSVWLTAHALLPFDIVVTPVLDILAGLHYSTAHRLVMPVAMFTLIAAAVGLAVALRLITGGPVAYLLDPERSRTRRAWRQITTAVAVVLALPLGWGVAVWSINFAGDGARESLVAPRFDDRMVHAADLASWDWLAEQPHAYDGLIAGEPADGSGWMYAYNGLPNLYRHYLWPTTERNSATDRSYWNANLVGEGLRGDPAAPNVVDDAIAELDIYYFVLSPWSFWAEQMPRWEQVHGLWTADGTTPVYQDGRITVFAVTDKFTDAELEQILADSPHPPPLPAQDPTPPVAPVAEPSADAGQDLG